MAATTTWGHLAMAGDQLFVRELEALSVFQYPAPAATTPPQESGAPEIIQ